MKKLLLGLLGLILLSPLGLLAPGTAWGEWGPEEIRQMKGFVPQGMNRFSEVVKAIFPDYAVPGLEHSFLQTAVGYIISSFAGIALIACFFWIFGRFCQGNSPSRDTK